MPTDYSQFIPLLAQAMIDLQKLGAIVHGDASATVETDAGTVDSLAKAIAAITAQAGPVHDDFTGDGVETDWALSTTPKSAAALLVFVDDAPTRSFTLAGSTLTIDPAVGNGLSIETIDLSSTAAIDAADLKAVADIAADIATAAGDSAAIQTVAGDSADIQTVAADLNGADTIGQAITKAAEAAASAAAAAASETNAATSETNAATSATNAGTAQTAAEAAQTAAETAETNAETAEANAAASAAAAATSESNAASSASTAASAAAKALFAAEHPGLELPGIAIPFHDGASGEDFTVVRATTVNTRFTRQRLLATVAANALRYDHDPETGVARGIRIEPQRTNLDDDSGDFSGWTLNDIVLTANDAMSPDGIVNATKYTMDGALSGNAVIQRAAIAVSANTPYTYSIKLKQDDLEFLVVALIGDSSGHGSKFVDLSNMVLGGNYIAGPDSAAIRKLGGGWAQVDITKTTDGSDTTLQVFLIAASADGVLYSGGSETKSCWIHDSQLVKGDIATSLIPTAGTQVTADGDDISLDPSAQDWFASEAQEGTFYFDVDFDWAAINAGFFFMRETQSTGLGFSVRTTTGGVAVESLDGAKRGDTVTLRLSPTGAWFTEHARTGLTLGRHKVAVAWDRENISWTIDGAVVETRALTSETPTDFNFLGLGVFTAGIHSMVGTWRDLDYWPRKLPDADLVTLTAA